MRPHVHPKLTIDATRVWSMLSPPAAGCANSAAACTPRLSQSVKLPVDWPEQLSTLASERYLPCQLAVDSLPTQQGQELELAGEL